MLYKQETKDKSKKTAEVRHPSRHRRDSSLDKANKRSKNREPGEELGARFYKQAVVATESSNTSVPSSQIPIPRPASKVELKTTASNQLIGEQASAQ